MPLNMADTRPVVDVGWLEMSKASGSYLCLSGAKLTRMQLMPTLFHDYEVELCDPSKDTREVAW